MVEEAAATIAEQQQQLRQQAATIAELGAQIAGLVAVVASQQQLHLQTVDDRVATATAKAIHLLFIMGCQGDLATLTNKVFIFCNSVNNSHTEPR